MPTASYELPYDGAKEMLLVDEVDDKSKTCWNTRINNSDSFL
jgi:hypothetical protein